MTARDCAGFSKLLRRLGCGTAAWKQGPKSAECNKKCNARYASGVNCRTDWRRSVDGPCSKYPCWPQWREESKASKFAILVLRLLGFDIPDYVEKNCAKQQLAAALMSRTPAIFSWSYILFPFITSGYLLPLNFWQTFGGIQRAEPFRKNHALQFKWPWLPPSWGCWSSLRFWRCAYSVPPIVRWQLGHLADTRKVQKRWWTT